MASVAFIARVAVQVALGFYIHPDAYEYDFIARNLVAGEGFTYPHYGTLYRAYTFPLYPLMLAGVYLITGLSPVGVGLLQAVLGALLACIVYLFSRSYGRNVALLAGVGAGLHPGLVVTAAKIHALNVQAPLAALTAWIVRAIWERPDTRRAVVGGVLGGIAALERPTLVPPILLALAIGGWRAGRIRQGLRLTLLGSAIVFGVVSPWLVRNAIVLGQPVMTSGNENFWLGNNPIATGGAGGPDGRPLIDSLPDFKQRIWGLPDTAQDEIFGTEAMDYVVADPGAAVGRTLMKLFYFWWFAPYVGQDYPQAWTVLYGFYYVALISLAAIGAFASWRGPGRSSLMAIALTAVPLSLFQALYYVEGRHRWVIEPLLVVLASVGLVAMVVRARSTITRGAAARPP